MILKALCALTTGAAFATSAHAELRLPAVISDHMVLQADHPVPVWGMAAPASTVTVRFAGQTPTATADQRGFWMLSLHPLHASENGAEMVITESNGASPAASVTVADVLVGEVWLAGGQSNMAYGLSAMQGHEPIAATANVPQLRLFTVQHNTSADPLGMRPGAIAGDVKGKWELSNEKTALAFSAVGVMFGLELQRSLHRPVGIISSNWGGTPIKTWMPISALEANPELAHYAAEYRKAREEHLRQAADPSIDATYRAEQKRWQQEVGDKFNADMARWNHVHEAGGDADPKPKSPRTEPQNPDPTGIPLGGYRPQTPAISWNAMFQPLVPFAIKGALWYQGEANVSGYKDYGLMLRTMATAWREQWNEPDMEFLCVQLPGLGANEGKRDIAFMREQQASILTLPHTGLDVTFDIGDPGNVHPTSKVDLAHRLTLIARAKVYGEKAPYTGPVFASATAHGSTLRVRFRDFAGALLIGQPPWLAREAKPFPSDRLVGFEVAGADADFHEATAAIEGDTVLLSAPAVAKPLFVRYAWDNTPVANLYDRAGLPATPFRTGPHQP